MEWYKRQRLRGIEIVLYWQCRLNTSDIINAFGISRIQASSDIKQYILSYPGIMYYDRQKKAYIKSGAFKPRLSRGTVDEYIDHISRMNTPHERLSIESLTPHYRQLHPEIASTVLQAIRKKVGVQIVYGSMSNPQGSSRVIYPHSLVDTGFRWHIRAYCANRESFRDFNLGRIVGDTSLVDAGGTHTTLEYDEQWGTEVKLQLKANPLLNKHQQQLVEAEFGIKRGSLFVSARACLVAYELQRYQIDLTCLESPPKTQLLVVANHEALTSYLFG